MGSFDANYTRKTLAHFSVEQRGRLHELHTELDNKFEEIALLFADSLGLHKDDSCIDEEVRQAIDRWDEDVEMADRPVTPTTRLQQLLSEHHEIAVRIQCVWDDALEEHLPYLGGDSGCDFY